MAAPAPIRVLLVDDDAEERGGIARTLEEAGDLAVVATASNGLQALETLASVEVDVVLLDVDMPVMDGITALPLILNLHPGVRVIMASSRTDHDAAVTMQALALGASDYVAKPSSRVAEASREEDAREMVATVRAIGRAKRAIVDPRPTVAPLPRPPAPARPVATLPGGTSDVTPKVVAIACSTGGPNALAELLGGLPADFSLPILVTQHMPPVFSTLLAERLQRDSGRPCMEATDGMLVATGHVYVAPGDWHMLVRADAGEPVIRLERTPPENFCRPSADPMLRSIAEVYGAATVAVVLTGMGEDGLRGCTSVVACGGRVLAQDEASSVVWGMPAAIVRAGLAHAVLPLADIAGTIASLCRQPGE
ncbi:MAG TPA: chemotaxis-specific protein-glutamate methyltransferase CheB [Gemmatimonadaceae bacterium]|nr:chemotaxis-specific protein-glutamate methyltransferase CheB [Gemmatimonadaceae bacterium]